jgi:hypothetical protein
MITESRTKDEKIGRMIFHFSDNSSNNHKKCGDEIFKKIQEQRISFEKPK